MDRVHDRGRQCGRGPRPRSGPGLFGISLAMWANGLRFIGGEGISAGELRVRARAACNIGGLERWGWITVGDGGGGRRDGYGSNRAVRKDTVLRPARAGACAQRLWPLVAAGAGQRWQARFGAQAIESVRQGLRPYAGRMPFAPPEVHAADGFCSHVVDGVEAGEQREEGHWLAGLLGQTLTRLTLDHESGSLVWLPLVANFLQAIASDVIPLRDLPALSGVSRQAVAMATGYLIRNRLAQPRPQRAISLTAAGRAALAGYQARATRPHDQALSAALAAVLSQRPRLAEGLVPPEGCWRGQRPHLARAQHVLAGPAAHLPRHPMVLHRGGWPDGS